MVDGVARSDRLTALLVAARASALSGDADLALQATEALLGACAEDDPAAAPFRAEALLLAAESLLRLRGDFSAAGSFAQAAAQVWLLQDDWRGESRAMSLRALAASRIGDQETAVDCALFAIRLTEGLSPCPEQVVAHEALGVALYSGGCRPEGRLAFERAVQVARACEPPVETLELHLDLAIAAASEVVIERSAGTEVPDTAPLRACLDDAADALARPAATHLNALGAPTVREGVVAMGVLCDIWEGRADETAPAVERLARSTTLRRRPWLRALASWARLELALAQGRLDDASRHAAEMVETALCHRHDFLLGQAFDLARYVAVRRGDAEAAALALSRWVAYSQQQRARRLRQRGQEVDRELERRRAARTVRQLQGDAVLLRRLAMEDGLTGLPNRRHLEEQLQDWLAEDVAAPRRPAVVLIDVDEFKQVNDQHSHQVGDAVLRVLGQLLRELVRDGDLPARLGGDEFVVALRAATPDAARGLCRRVRSRIQSHDWDSLAPGLRVTVSLGHAMAQPGDNVALLLHRADRGMYGDKARRAAPRPPGTH